MENILKKIQKIPLSPRVYKDLPETPGVYIYLNGKTPIYVGKAVNIKKRVSSYFNLHLEFKTHKMIQDATQLSYIKVTSDFEALLLEAKLIKQYLPKYNIISKDDKHPLYIIITDEEFPRITTARKIDLKNKKLISYYGPFPSSANVKSILKLIRIIFPFCDHKFGKKPCLYSQIGLCDPCPNVIKTSDDYNRLRKIYLLNISRIKKILDGKNEIIKKELLKEMKKFSSAQKYEEASIIKNKISQLDYITNSGTSISGYIENPNLYEDIRLKEINDLKNILNKFDLKVKHLNRIECFDVAHLQGASASASMVTFVNGSPDKNYYRHFRIYQKNAQDDYSSMNEVARRRIKHLKDWGKPDLIIVDGGKGQLSVFLKHFKSASIPVIGLAKKNETLIFPSVKFKSNTFVEYIMPKGNALNLVQRLRNEAHRFAQRYHHRLFKLSLFESS